jgi:hypothetical protein
MAIRIPLVIVNGQIQQLQTGDGISVAAAQYDNRVATNGEASTALTAGMVVYASGAGAAKRAQANAASTAGIVGVWMDASTAASSSGNYAAGGVATATTTQWDAVAGTTGGLAANTLYYLDPATPGKMTSTAPTTVGQLVVIVGRALSTTELELLLELPILL